MKKNIIVIQIINIIYFLLLLLNAKTESLFVIRQKNSIILSSISCLYSLFAIIILIKSKNNIKWIFLVINILIILIHLYGIYFSIVIYNS